MKKASLFYYLFIVFLATGFTFCKTSPHLESAVDPPLKNVDVQIQTYTILPAEMNEISLENGTQIIIPENTFVDADNNPVQNEVEIAYREFHSATDIIASGIPMSYDTGGASYDFESAGMFEIDASADGKAVYIKDGKAITVEMASFQQGTDYNFYALDETSGSWSYMGNGDPVSAEESNSGIPVAGDMETASESIIMPVSVKEAEAGSIIDLDVDYEAFPELREFGSLVWTYANEESREKALTNKWIYKEKWMDISLDKAQNYYSIHLSNYENSYQLNVLPVLNEEDYAVAKEEFDQKLEVYEKAAARAEVERTRQRQEMALYRSFQINNLGIFNWDRIMKRSEMVTLNAAFDFGGSEEGQNGNITVFHIMEETAVIKYPSQYASNFRYNPNVKNRMIAILPGNKVAVYENKAFQNIDPERQGEDPYVFRMKISPIEVASMKDLDDILAAI